jgi:hypothetical protein
MKGMTKRTRQGKAKKTGQQAQGKIQTTEISVDAMNGVT